jgi:LacI family transcriptional regulator
LLEEEAVSIKQVAGVAGVSIATVSRVVNGSGPVAPETRKRVLEAVAALGYTPHAGARSLASRRTETLAFVLPEISGHFYSQLLRGAEIAARQAGYQLLVSGFHGSAAEMRKALRAIRGRVDAAVVMWPEAAYELLEESLPPKLPVLLLSPSGRADSPCLAVDNRGGAEQAVRHLLALGHKVLAHVTGPEQNLDARERREAFWEVLRGAGLAQNGVELPGDFTEDSAPALAARLLGLRPRPTAVFAANDAMALGLLLHLQKLGIRVPGDLSLVGFDDIPLARLVQPPLTTVQAHIETLGSRAVSRLVELLSQKPSRKGLELLPTQLVVRGSTAPPERSGNRGF